MIEFKNVAYTYPGAAAPVFRGLSLTVAPGEFLAVTGPGGSGKSTLAQLAAALIMPTEGTVAVDGMDTRDRSCQVAIRRTVGLLFQNPDEQFVSSEVAEDVAFGPGNLALPPAEICERVAWALAAVDMTAAAGRDPARLSGGEKQRAALAGVFALRPRYLLLDEPTASLDAAHADALIAFLQKMRTEFACAVVAITHDQRVTAAAERIFAFPFSQETVHAPAVP